MTAHRSLTEPVSSMFEDDGPESASPSRRGAELGRAESWERERFYFAALDVADLPASIRRGDSEAARLVLDTRLERFVPVKVEYLATAYARIDEETVAACAIDEEHLAGVSPGTTALFPSSLPEGWEGKIEPHALNVLVGPREPEPVRAVRRQTRLVVWAGLVAALAAVWLGLERRVSVLALDTEAAEAATLALAAGVGGSGTSTGAVKALSAERDRLVATRGKAARSVISRDAAVDLSAVLAVWPAGIDVRTDRLDVGPDRTNIAVRLGSRGDLDALVAALSELDGHTIDVGRVETTAEGIRVTISLERDPRSAGEGSVP